MGRQQTRSQPESILADLIAAADFPCIGAKSALAQGRLQTCVAGDLRGDGDDVAIVRTLQSFADAAPADAVFVSCAVVFPDTPPLDERGFERALWQRLQALHELDASGHAWDPAVSSDPASPFFSFSIGGRGFYVVGLHPGAKRAARRARCASLVFNLHSQFEALRGDGRYDRLRETIARRDIAYSGSRNPMLAAHGTASEARQYSGRVVGADWKCPFHAVARPMSDDA